MTPAPEGSPWRGLATYANLGTTLFACVAVGLGAGYAADRWLGTEPWLILVGLCLGIAAAGMNLVRAIRMLNRMDEDDGTT
jgi:ATP synthase protein I